MVRPAPGQERAFVGRQAAMQVLADLVDDGAGRVGHVHGGRSVLLRQFLRLEDDPRSGTVHAPRLMDPWLRRVLAPALPHGGTLLPVGRAPPTRHVLEAASVLRRATAPLLSAMLPGVDGDDAVDRLLGLPFVDTCRDGLVVDEAVKTAIADFLRGANPLRYLDHRRTAWRELRAELGGAPPQELWRYTADVLYLIDDPVVREAFFPRDTPPMAVEPARPGDAAAIRTIVRRPDGADSAAVTERWWDVAPHSFSVVRDHHGDVAGFLVLLSGELLHDCRVPGDVVTAAWSRHLRDHPLPRGQSAVGLRRWLDSGHGESPGASQAACWLDVARTCMALRPALRRLYAVARDVATYRPVVEELGLRPLPHDDVELDGVRYSSVVLDFGPDSVDGWLASLLGRQLGLREERVLDEETRELMVQGRPRVLTPLEYGLLRHLSRRAGRLVTRPELLREVWGTQFTGGSNVVDAVVRTLRVKLGSGADVVETLRGSGYRLRADWRDHLG